VSRSSRTLISDLGGVVVDFSFEHAYDHWAERLGISVNEIVFPYRDALYHDFERGRVTTAEFTAHLSGVLGHTIGEEVFLAGWQRVFTGVNAEVVELYRELNAHDVRIVGLTNTNEAHVEVWSRQFAEHLDVFAAIYASSEIGARKPDPDAFHHVLEEEALEPREAVFIDDTGYCVDGAGAVGIDALLFHNAGQLRADLRARGLPA
jgi:glucose-1-phosphatase